MSNGKFQTPPLEWIRAFEAAARCGSFTAAAAETGLTQSAISQRIGQLEKRLGATLFYRRARSIEMTVEGEAWLPHVRSALSTLHDSSETLFGTSRKRMTISASQSIIELWLIPRLQQIHSRSGGELSIQTMVLGAHDAALDEVIRVRYGTGNWPHPYKHKLFDERIAPMASPELARATGHWTEWPRITCSGPRPGWTEWVSQFGIPTTPVPRFRFDTFLSALGAARCSHGVVLGSLSLCAADLAAGRLVRLDENELSHHESYWAIAGTDACTQAEWKELVANLK